MNKPSQFDVIIIGGGPAGSCAALRLVELGHNVALMEQAVFPRDQIGESLSPGTRNIFSYLKADDLLHRNEYLQSLDASVIWNSKEASKVNAGQRGAGVMVDRGKLDSDLIQLAVSRGLHLYQPARFVASHKTGSMWQVDLIHDNVKKTITATFVLDARGRKGTALNDRALVAPATVALWTHIPGDLMTRETIIEAVEDGWLWGSPLTCNKFRVMAFMDAAMLKKASSPAVFSRLLSDSVLFRAARSSINEADIQACSVLPYCHSAPWEDNYIRLGEAAFTLDPLSSTGVEKAMRFSMQTVIAINTIARHGRQQLARSFYEDRIIESVAMHTQWTRNYYAQAWCAGNNKFWQDRSVEFPVSCENTTPFFHRLVAKLSQPPKTGTPGSHKEINMKTALNHLWHQRIKISPDLSFIETPCVVDDCVALGTAITHPHLAREMAYLEQAEIAPLLRAAECADTFGTAVTIWSNYVPLEKASRIAVCLWDIGILQIA